MTEALSERCRAHAPMDVHTHVLVCRTVHGSASAHKPTCIWCACNRRMPGHITLVACKVHGSGTLARHVRGKHVTRLRVMPASRSKKVQGCSLSMSHQGMCNNVFTRTYRSLAAQPPPATRPAEESSQQALCIDSNGLQSGPTGVHEKSLHSSCVQTLLRAPGA